jgi:hypothetical protein
MLPPSSGLKFMIKEKYPLQCIQPIEIPEAGRSNQENNKFCFSTVKTSNYTSQLHMPEA